MNDSAVRIRPILPGDDLGLCAFYAALSDESRRTRFLGAAIGIAAAQSTYFCMPDHAHREGFVAIADSATDPERIVGHICIEPDGASCAELAVAVADECRGQGVGRKLVEAAVDWARQDGYHTLSATMFAGNVAIQRLLTDVGLPAATTPSGAGTIELRIDLRAGRRIAA
jgi:acetyltransferase